MELFAPRKLNATAGARKEEGSREDGGGGEELGEMFSLHEFAVCNACLPAAVSSTRPSSMPSSLNVMACSNPARDFRKIEEEFRTLFVRSSQHIRRRTPACLSVLAQAFGFAGAGEEMEGFHPT